MSITRIEKRLSLKAQTLATLIAIASAVALPQIFHLLGKISGLGTALGEVFLPMHLPILAVGLLAGSWAGSIAGLLSPLLSFALTGMPTTAMLPFMMIELCAYGLVTGLMQNNKAPVLAKILTAQLAGRAIRAVALLIAAYGFESTAIPVSVIWSSIGTGLFGLALQWVLLPLFLYRVEHAMSHDD